MSASVTGAVRARGAPARVREAAALAAICALMLGGAYAASWLAARVGLPVSRGLIFEGQWIAPTLSRFPWADCSAMLFFMVIAPLAWEIWRGVSPRSVGFRSNAVSVALAAAVMVPAGVMWYVRHSVAREFGQDAGAGSPALLLLYFLVVAVSEETAFRGMIQRRAAGLAGLYGSIAIASVAFVLWHGVPADATQLAIRFGAAVVLGAVYRLTGSLLAPIALHCAFNVVVCAG